MRIAEHDARAEVAQDETAALAELPESPKKRLRAKALKMAHAVAQLRAESEHGASVTRHEEAIRMADMRVPEQGGDDEAGTSGGHEVDKIEQCVHIRK